MGCVDRIRPSTGCENNDECAALEMCEAGKCVAQALLPHDGGSGREDGGPVILLDAGEADGGSSSTIDAGLADGGVLRNDAGADAGMAFVDAGTKTDGGETVVDGGGTAVDAGENQDAGVVEPQVNIPAIGISRRVAGELVAGGQRTLEPQTLVRRKPVRQACFTQLTF
ncbi:MAG: hypothetical protein GY822_28820 [Deltaproteobacteria bacterium]|nr:hypothetical protein [Deltaproteobacteria bacterium]